MYAATEARQKGTDTMTTTTANRIAALLDDDGQRWEADDGTSLEALCLAERPAVTYRGDRGIYDTPIRYEFDDGSAIVVSGDAWDLGYRGHDLDCWCWVGAGHNDECPHG